MNLVAALDIGYLIIIRCTRQQQLCTEKDVKEEKEGRNSFNVFLWSAERTPTKGKYIMYGELYVLYAYYVLCFTHI